MDIMKRLYFLCSLFLVLGTLLSCGSEDEFVIDDGSANNTDVAVTGLVEKYGATYATISGYVNLQLLTSVGNNPIIGVEMSEVEVTEEGEILHNTYKESTSELVGKKFCVDFNRLRGNCKYKYRSYVDAGNITYYGRYRYFSTTDFVNLTTTGDATNVTFTSANIKFRVDMGTNSGKERFVVGVAYSTNKSKLHVLGSFGEEYFSEDNLKNTSYTVNLKDLLPGKTYYYASYTKAGDTYKFGMIKSFTTKSLQEQLTTGNASDIAYTTASIKGGTSLASFYPKGTKIGYEVRYATSEEVLRYPDIPEGCILYGRDSGYDVYYNSYTHKYIKHPIKYSMSSVSISDGINIISKLSGLKIDQTYYYCVYAGVDGVLLQGEIKKFTTKDLQTNGCVDLDLSCKWAACNLGASSPESFGDYYAWGELETKTSYTYSNYAYYPTAPSVEISGTQYDVARKKLGDPWRMPTRDECWELIENCKIEDVTYKNIDGYLVIGKNGNAIFLPKAGYKYNDSSIPGCAYWSSTYSYYNAAVYQLNGRTLTTDGQNGLCGCSIRPVQ